MSYNDVVLYMLDTMDLNPNLIDYIEDMDVDFENALKEVAMLEHQLGYDSKQALNMVITKFGTFYRKSDRNGGLILLNDYINGDEDIDFKIKSGYYKNAADMSYKEREKYLNGGYLDYISDQDAFELMDELSYMPEKAVKAFDRKFGTNYEENKFSKTRYWW